MPQPGRVPDAGTWTALRVEVSAEAVDAVVNFLIEAGAPGVLVADEAPAGRTALETSVQAHDAGRVAAAVRAYLASLGEIAAHLGGGTVATAPIAPVDWEAEARAHHRPVVVGRRLVVAPPWDVPDAAGRELLVIEPGMAFGTGQHASTAGCLAAIDELLAARAVANALDVGTGSGILALALARLGVPDVVAVDVDPAVLPIARENLRRNGIERVALLAGTVRAVRRRFDLVVANLLADLLVASAADLGAAVGPGGVLIASGLLAAQADGVAAAFPGFRVAATHAIDGWDTLSLVRTA